MVYKSAKPGLRREAMERNEALQLMKKYLRNRNLQKHCLAVEAVMRRLAKGFGEDEEKWGLAGLLHDLDYDETAKDMARHGYRTIEILKDYHLPEDVLHAILAHPGHVERKSLMDKALYCVDPVTGLIVAAALIHPEKSLAPLDARFIMNRFREKHFAKGANREQMASCTQMGLTLEQFLEISLGAMKEISNALGL